MHKDEGTKVKAAPTNQSDSGWRARLSWQVDCDGKMAKIEHRVCEWMFVQLFHLTSIQPHKFSKKKTKELIIIIWNSGLL